MMFNDRTWRTIGIAVPVLTIATLWGMLESLQLGLNQNIGSTGITMKAILVILNAVLIYAIWKRRI